MSESAIVQSGRAREAYRMLDASPDTVTRYDTDARYLYVNAAMERLTGYSREKMIGRRVGEFGATPETAAIFISTIKKIIGTKQQETIEFRFGDRIFQALLVPEIGRQGDVESVIAFARNITEIVSAEERYRLLYETMTQGVVHQDRAGRIVSANRAALAILGEPREEFVGSSSEEEENKTIREDGTPFPGDEHPAMAALRSGREVRGVVMGVYNPRKRQHVWIRIDAIPLFRQGEKKPYEVYTLFDDVTERRKAQQELERSRHWFERVASTSPNIIFVLDIVENRNVYSNKSILQVLGYTPDEFRHIGNILRKTTYPDDVAKVETFYRDMSDAPSGTVRVLTHRSFHKDGSVRWMENTVSPFSWGADGRVKEVIGISREITGRVAAEETLRASEKKYRLLVETANSIIQQWDTNGTVTFMNDYGLAFFGYARDEVIGQSVMKMVRREGSAGQDWSRLVSDILACPEKHINYINENVRKNGETVWIFWNNRAITDENGKITGILAIGNDITELKKAEETLRRNEYELRTLVDNSPDLIFRVNRQLQYVFVNPAYERLTGIPRDRFIGKTNEELGMPGALAGFWKDALCRVLDTGRESSAEFDMTGFFGKRYFFARLIPEFDPSGMVETILALTRDISERKRAEEQIRYISFHDEITGLFNRTFFEEEIRRMDTDRNLPISIIVAGVNNLKLTNDVFGHADGDRLLKTVAGSFRKACRQSDIVARWSGDVFAVILPGTDQATAGEIGARVAAIAGGSGDTALRPYVVTGTAVKERSEQKIYQTVRRAEERMSDRKLAERKQDQEAVLSGLLERLRRINADFPEHLVRSRELARSFGKALALADDRRDALDLLIKLHDIGDAAVPGEILMKPGRLAPEEWETVKKHSEAGFRIAGAFPDTAGIADDILSHGECWNGSGYPRGLKGGEIPCLARVFLVIDAYDVMTHHRPYAPALTDDEAVGELCRNAGRQFDPGLVEIFVRDVLGKKTVSG